MPAPTNQLVAKKWKLILPTSLAAVAIASSALVLHQNNVHAAGITAAPLDDDSVAALTSVDRAMESLAARVTPAVVSVAVTSKAEEQSAEMQGAGPQGLPPGLEQFFGNGGGRQMPQQPEFQHGIGSGVIISPDGYIVTNNHVVDGATQIKVTLHDRRRLNAKVIGVDKLTDLAVIKVDAQELPAMSWAIRQSCSQARPCLPLAVRLATSSFPSHVAS